ncbi:hypothetical protein, conserved [Leishmania tarentolae]|uniref:Transmembrane protein n=1 Tax=Leishmania tarentolae TaxID=5689 RepID=A0A640KD69_LEITA|nr:hypothetical protein, conserved [Leishmania tarentolae]
MRRYLEALRSALRDGRTALTHALPLSSKSSSEVARSAGADGSAATAASGWASRSAVKGVYRSTQRTPDPFLRDGTVSSRFFRAYRTTLPFPARMLGIFLVGFSLGLVLEVFACKTHLYESVMMKKDARRHEFDEFVVDFRQNVERWQREDMGKRQSL